MRARRPYGQIFFVCVLLIYLSIDGDWVGVAARLCVARAQLHVFKHSGIASRGREFTHQNTTVHDATNQLLDSENEVWFSTSVVSGSKKIEKN